MYVPMLGKNKVGVYVLLEIYVEQLQLYILPVTFRKESKVANREHFLLYSHNTEKSSKIVSLNTTSAISFKKNI